MIWKISAYNKSTGSICLRILYCWLDKSIEDCFQALKIAHIVE